MFTFSFCKNSPADMDEELFPVKVEDLELIEQLSSILSPELDTVIQLESLGDRDTDSDRFEQEKFLPLESGLSLLPPAPCPQNLLGIESEENIILESSESNSWNLIRSPQDTPTDYSDGLSLKSFEQDGLDDLLALDPTEYDSIFQIIPQDPSQPGSKASQHSALIRDIDITAELLAELCKLDLDENPESTSDTKPNWESETDFNTAFDIYPYCQPCQDNFSSVTELDPSFTDTFFIPILQLTDPSMSSPTMNLQHSVPDSNPDSSQDSESVALYHSIIASFSRETKNERVYLGHKETIFGMSFSPCGRFVATASQDSTIRIWSSTTNQCLSTLKGHNAKYECLRVAWASSDWVQKCQSLWTSTSDKVGSSLILASAGADGIVKIWHSVNDAKTWNCLSTIAHLSPETWKVKETDKVKDDTEDEEEEEEEEEEEDKPQIYTIQFIDGWNPSNHPSYSSNFHSPSCVLTASDDFIHLWEPQSFESNENIIPGQLLMSRIMSIRFTHLEMGFGGVFVLFTGDDIEESPNTFQYPKVEIDQPSSSKQAYGGPRNPDNLVYVFDASYCHANGLLGVALSDGSLRLVNGRGSCVSVLQLPECNARLTSFAWDSSGQRIASCVATGHIILWSILIIDESGRTQASCNAVLEGGHARGRPLYGVRYVGTRRQDMLISWGIDGNLCLWAADDRGNVTSPLKTMVSKSEYPIFAADVSEVVRASGATSDSIYIGIAGGNDGGFIGTPFYLYDIML